MKDAFVHVVGYYGMVFFPTFCSPEAFIVSITTCNMVRKIAELAFLLKVI